MHENPQSGDTCFVYVRIHNMDTALSSYGNEQLFIHWSKAATNMEWSDSWWGGTFPGTNLLKGDLIDSVPIPVIPPSSDTVLVIPWLVPNSDDYRVLDPLRGSWHFCLLGRIIKPDEPMTYPETTNTSENVINNNRIAQKNLSIIDTWTAKLDANLLIDCHSGSFGLTFSEPDDLPRLPDESEVTIRLDSILYLAWLRGGMQCAGIELISDGTFLLKTANAYLHNLIFEPYEFGFLSVKFNFLTQQMTPQTNYEFHVMQTNTAGEVLGGEAYSIIKSPRVPFYASATVTSTMENGLPIRTLLAKNIGEPAVYNWYNEEGTWVHEGMTYSMPRPETNETYTLEVTALRDGYKDYAEAIVRASGIMNLYPNPPVDDMMNIAYALDAQDAANAIIRVSVLIFGTVYEVFDVSNTDGGILSLNTSTYPRSYPFVVSLICNGAVIDSKMFLTAP